MLTLTYNPLLLPTDEAVYHFCTRRPGSTSRQPVYELVRGLRRAAVLHSGHYLSVLEFGDRRQRLHHHLYVDHDPRFGTGLGALAQAIWDRNARHVHQSFAAEPFGLVEATFFNPRNPDELAAAAGYATKSNASPNLPEWFRQLPHRQRFNSSRGFYPRVRPRWRRLARASRTGLSRREFHAGRQDRAVADRFALRTPDGNFLGTIPRDLAVDLLGRRLAHGDWLTFDEAQFLLRAPVSRLVSTGDP